jgi:hypothetical protein
MYSIMRTLYVSGWRRHSTVSGRLAGDTEASPQLRTSGRRARMSQISSHFYAASNISLLSTKTRLRPAFRPRKLKLKLKVKVKAFLLLKVR